MSITKFGEFMRDLRVSNGENLRDMAGKIGVSFQFLSAVENGKKKIPNNWFDTIVKKYNLLNDAKKTLEEAIHSTQENIMLSLEGVNSQNRDLAFVFARSFKELTDEEMKKIQGILVKKKGKKKND